MNRLVKRTKVGGAFQLKLWTVAVFMLGFMLAGPMIPAASAVTFDSGTVCTSTTDTTSTDGNGHTCLGAFSPTVNTTIQLPPDGMLDYATYYVPAGVTVYYCRNAANTPVTIRTYGNVTIEGVINVSATVCGQGAKHSGTASDGNLGDDGQPGTGGPGGFDGGYGGYSALFGGAAWKKGGGGNGPGGGQTGPGSNPCNGGYPSAGAGGGFGTAGGDSYCVGGSGGATYGQSTLLPLIGGSGGGGGPAGTTYNGAGGGGGGGAILISAGTASAPATITVGKNGTYGYIYADGSGGGSSSGSGCGGDGGGGSGGAIRLVANTLANPGPGYGILYARGGGYGGGCYGNGGGGGYGRIRLEANTITGWTVSQTDPDYSFGTPGHVLVPNGPTLVISSVTPTTGTPVAVPANPTGNADITFPEGTTSATVSLAATYIPVGTTVTVYVVPASGANRSSALSNALAGTEASSTATATVTLSPGNNVLMAAATYTVTEILAMNLPTFDDGIRVAKVRVESTMGGESKITYITASGKEYAADSPHRDRPGKVKKTG